MNRLDQQKTLAELKLLVEESNFIHKKPVKITPQVHLTVNLFL